MPASAETRHVGATAIPGCLTKGDLDVAVRVERADFAAADERLARLFARNDGSIRTEEFSAFADASRMPHLGVQLTVKGGALDLFHPFADALRSEPALVERYNALKRAYQNQPMALYRAAKDAFISEVLNIRFPS
ncbi:GrpB family protein [Methylobacterium phyllostachyos]|uniref:GrpB family protein n=1 Tax=Methylobacterium phyllostachyos TaxID=582672 RepID=UPI001FCCC871|nr:GrpB family protein [Methylobacterium phyllostachyos]